MRVVDVPIDMLNMIFGFIGTNFSFHNIVCTCRMFKSQRVKISTVFNFTISPRKFNILRGLKPRGITIDNPHCLLMDDDVDFLVDLNLIEFATRCDQTVNFAKWTRLEILHAPFLKVKNFPKTLRVLNYYQLNEIPQLDHLESLSTVWRQQPQENLFPKLKKLTLIDSRLDCVPDLTLYTTLKELFIWQQHPEMHKCFTTVPQLEVLHIHYPCNTLRGVEHLKNLKEFLCECGEFGSLDEFENHTHLQELYLPFSTELENVSALKTMSNLQIVELRGCFELMIEKIEFPKTLKRLIVDKDNIDAVRSAFGNRPSSDLDILAHD